MTTLQAVELGVLGPLQVRQDGTPVAIPGTKPRAIITMLGLHGGSVVSADTLLELLWGDDPPRTAAKALQTHISALRRTLGDGFVLTEGAGWTLAGSEVDASRYKMATRLGRAAAAAGDTNQAVARFEEALRLWRGTPELPDGQRGSSEKTRWIEAHAAVVEDRADALLATGRAAEIIGELESAVAEAPLRERRWGQLMLALYRSGRQGEALAAYQRARSLLADQLGVDPGPDLRRLEAAIVGQEAALDMPVAQQVSSVTRAVTFLLTDIEGSTAAWEADAVAMAVALARHDELVEQVVTSRGGRLIKTRGEGDATFSVFERPSAAAAAAIELQDAITHEPWTLREPMRIRVALHTGEVELRDGDYFGRAVNRAARLRSLATGGQILCSGATAELVIDSLHDDVVLVDLGMRQLRNLARLEHVFELRMQTADDVSDAPSDEAPFSRPDLPTVLTGQGPFVGRGSELDRLSSTWQIALAGGMRAVLIAGEPGVGKTRLAGEWSRQAFEQDAAVLYGRCDEDLGAPYQPFAEALRSLVPCLGAGRLRGVRGVEALLSLVPGLADVLPDLAAPTSADPDTERYALFDAVAAVLEIASASVPIVLVLDDIHWAAKPTLLLLRHLLRFGEQSRVQIVGTYRSTDLDRSHPLAAMLADLHRDGTAERLQLSGLDEDDVTTYVAEAGYDDEELARALASVTGGNPFFLIEALRHVQESGGRWDQSTLPQGVREAVSRRLSRLPVETNKALAAAAVVGSRFAVELVERVVDQDLVDAFDEACKAGIVIEEPGGRYRFNHAIVRQALLAELPSVRRMRLHQRIATTLETEPGAGDELLAELAHHYFECAWAGNAAKAVDYCRRAADQAMARLAYEGAADLYDQALHALEELEEELPDRDDQTAELLVARCEALLAAGDMASATDAVAQLQAATRDSARLTAWATCFDSQLSMLIHPERLDDIEAAVGAAAGKLAELEDAAGEAKAHTVRAACLFRLGRIGDCEIALDHALTAARQAREHRRVNAVLAGAPLAALWGPNPVPRAGGRCLDVVRLLRITTDSPAVEATSTRCQAVLEAFRGRAAAARRMIESARRTVTELGLRHALLEVEQFAGIVELVADDPVAAEPHLRKAYSGFRRMGLDADTAETAALLGRTCLALDRDTEADKLCTESEQLAGHALKASIAWRTLRAQLLSRRGEHAEARRMAEAAVGVAESTDALVDHGDACLTFAIVLDAAGDVAGARAAAERATGLYELKDAAALVEMARRTVGRADHFDTPAPVSQGPNAELINECTQVGERLLATVNREAWDEVEQSFAPKVYVESRRKIVGFSPIQLPARRWSYEMRRYFQAGMVRFRHEFVAVRGERHALIRVEAGTADPSLGAPRDEMLQVVSLDDEGRIQRQVWFDVEDIDAAIAELDAAHAALEAATRTRRLENKASRMYERFKACYASRDLDALGEIIAADVCTDDRRRVVNAGVRRGREAVMAELLGFIEIGALAMSFDVIATRGDRLILNRSRITASDPRNAQIDTEIIEVIEVDADEHLAQRVVFDANDIDAAFNELETRYLEGEAAAHARTWSVLAAGHAAVNRHELPPITPDCVNIDHRRGGAFAPGEMIPYLRASWDVDEEIQTYVESVHRLTDLGAVYTYAGQGISREGFDAEWRGVSLLTVVGDLVSRCEIFEEADLAGVLTRFEQLRPKARRLENTASRVVERLISQFAARNWDAITDMLADDYYSDDRRRVVGAGVRHGRDAEIVNMRTIAELWIMNMTSTVIATRGERLFLTRAHYSGRDQGPEAFHTDVLGIVEIDADERIVARVGFDPNNLDGAFEELEARYLAGEAAAHARTWAAIAGTFAAANRREAVTTTEPDWVNIDHRRATAVSPGNAIGSLHTMWDLAPNFAMHIEAVHRLTDLGAVAAYAASGRTQGGFDAEWRHVNLFTVDGDVLNRCEIFDESDLDTALARFAELHRPKPLLHNAASRFLERYLPHFAARDWDAMTAMLANDFCTDDRRRVVNAGVFQGRDIEVANIRAIAELGVERMTSTPIATRGERLVLNRTNLFHPEWPEEFNHQVIDVVELNDDDQASVHVIFDFDDIDAAFDELDARFMAGDAAPHSQMWSALARCLASINRRELPETTLDWVNVDHRRSASAETGELATFLSTTWDHTPELTNYVETVHRLSDTATVITYAARGTSQDGFDAEWRVVNLFTFEGERVSRVELFDETDLDLALATFDELTQPPQRLMNSASQLFDLFRASLAARDWEAMAGMLAATASNEDRRRVVNAETRLGRDAVLEDLQASVDVVGITYTSVSVIATRGDHLVLVRAHLGNNDRPEEVQFDILQTIEADDEGRIVAVVTFDEDDIVTAIKELDDRYLAGESVPHAHTWSVINHAYAALNRHEVPSTTPDWVDTDHRSLAPIASGDLLAWLGSATQDLANLTVYPESVHRLTDVGAVLTHVTIGTSQSGFDAEWRMVGVLTLDGDLINNCELFDEEDLDTALARFDELTNQKPRLENAATRFGKQLADAYNRRDQDAYLSLAAPDGLFIDRRQGLHSESEASLRQNLQAVLDVSPNSFEMTWEPIAIRSSRLSLAHEVWEDHGQDDHPIAIELLTVMEVSHAGLLHVGVAFDTDDIDAAFAELEARYLAGEAAPHANTWSIIAGTYAALNRGELSRTTSNWVNVDHRRIARVELETEDLPAYLRATREVTPDLSVRIEAVHRLDDTGAVVTHAAHGTSSAGFDAEWRLIEVLVVEADQISRCEIFEEADLGAALETFDALSRPAPRLNNAAVRVAERFAASFEANDWGPATAMLAEDVAVDDRRRTVNAGMRRGRDAGIVDLQAAAGVGFTHIAGSFIATRGERLTLTRTRHSGDDGQPDAFQNENLTLVEINSEERLCGVVIFDLEDIDAAFEELDARYRDEEAATHAHTWSVITRAYATLNSQQIPAKTPDCVTVDHRRGVAYDGDVGTYLNATWDMAPDATMRIETVHLLTDRGAVVTFTSYGTSQDGFSADWRGLNLLTVEGELISRGEIFDEADLDAALARFDELSQPTSD